MEKPEWGPQLVKVIAGEVRRWRTRRQLSAQALSDATARLGWPIKRSVLSNLESGYRETITFPELYVLAAALEVPPLLLMLPLGHAETVEVLPGVQATTEDAIRWIRGEAPLPGMTWEGRVDAESPTVMLFNLHLITVDRWQRHRKLGEEREAEDDMQGLFSVRSLMRRQDLTPPPLPPELAALEEALA